MTEKEKQLEQSKKAYLAEAIEGELVVACDSPDEESASKSVGKKIRTVWKVVYRMLSILLVLSAIVVLLFHFFPDLRIRVLNKGYELYESQSVVSFEKFRKIAPELVITVGWIPEGFEKTADDFHSGASWKDFCNDKGASITIEKSFPNTITLGADDPETEIVKMHGYDATLMVENEEVYLIWMNEKEQIIYLIIAENLPVETVLKVAENLS